MSEQPEVTFRSYSQQQGATYSQHRRRYSPKLYDAITKFHESGSRQFGTLLDVGCGPGIATFTLAPKFKSAIGIDQSEGMISTARSLVGSSPGSDGIRFEVSSAEALGSDLADPIQEGSVDVITAATCAHWFDMAGFWSQAAKILKPGGTVALWTGGSIQVDESMPNYTAIQAIIDGLDDTLADYMLPGNLLTRDLYQRLPLPWTLESPVADFDQASFTRKEWRTGPGSDIGFFAETDQPFNFDIMELALGTASPVTRWREAHPEAVGTEDDVIKIVRRKIEKIFEEAGVKKGEELLKGDVNGVLLLAAFDRAHSLYEQARRGHNTRQLVTCRGPNGPTYLRDFYFVTSFGRRLSEERLCKLCSFFRQHAQEPAKGTYKLLAICSSETSLFEPLRKNARGRWVRRPWGDMEDNVLLAVVPELHGVPRTGVPLRWLETELPKKGSIYRLTQDVEGEDGRRLILPERLDPKADMEIVGYWQYTCGASHGSHCSPKKPPGATLRGFRAINCNKLPMPPELVSWGEKYAALSYVWGLSIYFLGISLLL
ncbi:hypothetical protein NM208_g8573 [Fusarium decemcellulare]|uniref:Uncharacterized protein n=1 Tax=Fusarium decemcellulare TaxID=57161 RepID=A0ACC1S4S2_9HYPO|nr:hypothetical protein NM208_g8573 [Fusarium decemcellulare]